MLLADIEHSIFSYLINVSIYLQKSILSLLSIGLIHAQNEIVTLIVRNSNIKIGIVFKFLMLLWGKVASTFEIQIC